MKKHLNQEDMWSIVNFEKASSEIKELTFFFENGTESKLKDKDQTFKSELKKIAAIALGSSMVSDNDILVGRCVNVASFAFKDNVAYANLKKTFSIKELFSQMEQGVSSKIQNLYSNPNNYKVNLEGLNGIRIEWKTK